jgi:hypothetical protein
MVLGFFVFSICDSHMFFTNDNSGLRFSDFHKILILKNIAQTLQIPPSPQMNSLPRIRGAFFISELEPSLLGREGGDKK